MGFFNNKKVSLIHQTSKMSLRLLYSFLCFSLTSEVFAQIIAEKDFVLYTTKDGLSNNHINAVTQDAYGYIWIATKKGLNRYDGSTFQQFYSDSSRNSIPEDFIHRLRWLDKERLAVITVNGLHIINSRTLQQHNIIIPPGSLKSLLPLNRVIDAFADKKGNIFIATATGFYQLGPKNELVFRYDHYSRKHIEERKSTAFSIKITPLEENILLIATFNGPYLFYIDQKDFHPPGKNDDAFYQQIGVPGKVVTIPHNDENSFSSIVIEEEKLSWFDTKLKTKYRINAPFVISEKIDGGTSPKLIRLNDTLFAINNRLSGFYLGRIDQATSSYQLSSKVYFKNVFCNSFFIDKNDQLWIATNKGLYKERKSASIIQQTTMPSSFSGDIQTLAVSNNKIFIGTIGEGLLLFDRVSLKQVGEIDFKVQRKTMLFPNFVLQVMPIHNDTLYAAIAGIWINTKNLTAGTIPISQLDTTYKAIDLLFKDSRNNIYLKKGEVNIFYHRKPHDNSFSMLDYRSDLAKLGLDVIGMAEDPEGNIWFSGLGMMRFNYKAQKFDLLLDSFPSIKTPRKSITSNLVFDKSVIYFGVYANGLMIYDQKQNRFSQLTRTDGLPDNNILALQLHNSKLWMATESGLACYDLATKKISSFGTTDGIPPNTGANYKLYFDSAHQHLYGTFSNTIFRFDPDKLTKNNIPPVFSIENIVIAGRETIFHPVDNIKLSYKQNNIVLNLAAVNFEDAYQQQFAFRLVKNGNEPWLPLGSQRSIIFSNLSAGDHQLQVKVFIRNQSWPDQIKEITIVILPPFWKTIWFYLIIALTTVAVLYYLHRRRINHIIQKANIDKQLAQTEMKALHSQMNPHFIFNCLNSIREMILNNENEQASLYLSKFARLIRITLNHSSKTFVSLADTIDYLQRYLEMEQIRKSNFTYTLEIDDDLQRNEILLPPMLIQPFIENAIWHGGATDKEIHLTIKFKRKENELICIVEDDGIGIEASLKKKESDLSYQSVGIANIMQRINVLNEKYNLQSTVEIKDKSSLNLMNAGPPDGQGTGTIVTLHLTIKPNETLV